MGVGRLLEIRGGGGGVIRRNNGGGSKEKVGMGK